MRNLESRKVFSLGLAFLAVAIFSALLAAQKPDPFVGDWKGGLSIDGEDFEITLHFTLNAVHEIVGTVDSPTQGAVGFPLGAIKIEGRKIEFGLPGAPGDPILKGVLDETGTKLTGTISQGGKDGVFQTEKVRTRGERPGRADGSPERNSESAG